MDSLDLRILHLLQRNADLTAEEVGRRVGLSKVPCWRRIQKLKASGTIARTVALLDPRSVNLHTTVFVMIKVAEHSTVAAQKFGRALQQLPEIIETHRLSGEFDYLIRVVVPDIGAYDAVYKRLIAATALSKVSASFVLDSAKNTTVLPLDYVVDSGSGDSGLSRPIRARRS